jgi:hypothetical protein
VSGVMKGLQNDAFEIGYGNVYLFAAAQGLAAWFHNCDKTGLAQQLGLRAEQRVLFAQSIVGYGMTEGLIQASRAELDKSFEQMNSRM